MSNNVARVELFGRVAKIKMTIPLRLTGLSNTTVRIALASLTPELRQLVRQVSAREGIPTSLRR